MPFLSKNSRCVLLSAADFSREEFAQTLAVIGNVRGRAPVMVDEKHIVCPEAGFGLNVCVYEFGGQFIAKGKLEVSLKRF